MYHLSSFKNRFINKPTQLDFESWKGFEAFLYLLSDRKLKGKQDAELISPAIYEIGTTRANKNVLSWAGWAAIDVDDVEIQGSVKEYIEKFLSNWRYICYSTASSKTDKPKFRIVLQLDRFIEASEIRHFWFALQSVVDDQGDKQCKDLSRMYYIPATYDNAFNFIFSGGSEPLNVSKLLSEHAYVEKKNTNNFIDRLPDEIQKQVIEYRKGQMDNHFIWSNYNDCPFVNKRLITEYKSIAYTDNTGRYSMIYKIMLSIASSAIKRKYPITTNEVVTLIRQLDMDTANRYENRPLDVEADRAIEYAYRNI